MSIEQQEARAEIRNWPTDRELKNTYSACVIRLRAEISDLKDQRIDLREMLAEMCRASDWPGKERSEVKHRAERLLESIRDTMETE